MERHPPMNWEDRAQLRKEANLRRPPAPTLDELATQSLHQVQPTPTGWRCRACAQSALRRRSTTARWWLLSPR
eukprot:2214333-Pyramimonas_sp.AAC.1